MVNFVVVGYYILRQLCNTLSVNLVSSLLSYVVEVQKVLEIVVSLFCDLFFGSCHVQVRYLGADVIIKSLAAPKKS